MSFDNRKPVPDKNLTVFSEPIIALATLHIAKSLI